MGLCASQGPQAAALGLTPLSCFESDHPNSASILNGTLGTPSKTNAAVAPCLLALHLWIQKTLVTCFHVQPFFLSLFSKQYRICHYLDSVSDCTSSHSLWPSPGLPVTGLLQVTSSLWCRFHIWRCAGHIYIVCLHCQTYPSVLSLLKVLDWSHSVVGAPGVGVGSSVSNMAISCACRMTLVSHLNYDFSFPSCEMSTAEHLYCSFKGGAEITVAYETVICEVTWNGGLL